MRHGREEGAVAIMVALMLVVFMAAVALTVDVGGLYLRRRALVNGSDAAALSAARTCSRGVGNDPRFASAEEAADFEVQANAPITNTEVAGTNLTYPPPGGCAVRTQYGHVTVQYTSQQSLYFAPVLGFDHQTPVTTTATASWGLGSNNPVPIVLSNLLAPGNCTMPPEGTIAIGQQCTFWYDNDTLNGGNFAFLSLNASGWDVDPNSNCSGSSSGGTSTLTQWINGTLPASVVLNWTYPTYVCTDTGIRGVGGKNGPNSQVWSALNSLVGQTKDFPINWEGCGTSAPFTACPPVAGAPSQGTIYQQGNIDKYDIIGFGAMTILHVYGSSDPQVQGTPAADYDCSGKVKNNTTIPVGTYTWFDLAALITGGPCKLPPSLPVDSVNSVSLQGLTSPADYTFDTNGITLTTALASQSNVAFSLHKNAQPGACGQQPSNNSAVCVITSWQGSTLTGDYQPNKDNITIVRLCDLAYTNSCLDQRPH